MHLNPPQTMRDWAVTHLASADTLWVEGSVLGPVRGLLPGPAPAWGVRCSRPTNSMRHPRLWAFTVICHLSENRALFYPVSVVFGGF